MKFSTTSASLLSIAFLQQASANGTSQLIVVLLSLRRLPSAHPFFPCSLRLAVQKRQYDTAAPWLEVASYSSIDPSVSAAYDVTASGGSPTVIYPTTAASVAAESLASSSTMVYPTSTSPATDTAMPSASMSADTSSSVMSSSSSMMSDSSTAAVWSSSMTDSAMPSLPTYAAVNSGGAPAYAPVNSGGNVAAPAPPAYAPVNSGGGGEMGMAKHHHNKGYGSGSHGKKNKGYQMCVQTCKVAFGRASLLPSCCLKQRKCTDFHRSPFRLPFPSRRISFIFIAFFIRRIIDGRWQAHCWSWRDCCRTQAGRSSNGTFRNDCRCRNQRYFRTSISLLLPPSCYHTMH